jgi:protein CsiD
VTLAWKERWQMPNDLNRMGRTAVAPQTFRVDPHPANPRLRHIVLDQNVLVAFLEEVARVDVQNLEYVPFMRFSLANSLLRLLGADFAKIVRSLVRDRASGGFTLGVQGLTADRQDFIKFGTAVGHIFGPSNHDAMSGKYYATFLIKHTDDSDSYLRQAYHALTLHTDGTFVDEATDWQLMMKFVEENASGGDSRLMHLDDWEDFSRFADDPLGARPIFYKAPGSKNVGEKIAQPTFFDNEYGRVISFIDQFACPQTMEEAIYLRDMSQSMEGSPATFELPLPVGDLIVLNNHFWVHGRAAFDKHPDLHRELMRQRGLLTT